MKLEVPGDIKYLGLCAVIRSRRLLTVQELTLNQNGTLRSRKLVGLLLA